VHRPKHGHLVRDVLLNLALARRNYFEMQAPIKITFILLVGLTAAMPAHAYIDPNSGGLIFQLLTPILALLATAVAFARRQIAYGWASLRRAVKGVFDRIFATFDRNPE
jgi:hypothetical protein